MSAKITSSFSFISFLFAAFCVYFIFYPRLQGRIYKQSKFFLITIVSFLFLSLLQHFPSQVQNDRNICTRYFIHFGKLCCCCSVAKSCLTLCDPMDCSTPGFPSSQNLLKLMSIQSVMPSKHLILCHPLLLLPSVFLRIRVFSKTFRILGSNKDSTPQQGISL